MDTERPEAPLEAPVVGAEPPEHRLGASPRGADANAFIIALARAARSFLLYDPGNEAIRHFLEALRASSDAYIQAWGELALTIRPWELVNDGEVVYLDRDRERSIAFKLYRDGVRKLTLDDGISWHELLKLLEVLSIRYTGIRQAEDDMVVLLWKAGFQHIQIEAVEGFVADEGGEEFEVGEGGEGGAARRAGMAADAPHDFDLPAVKLTKMAGVRFREVPAPALEELVAEDGSGALPAACVRLFEELVATAGDITANMPFSEVVPQLREIRDFLLAEGLLGSVLGVVRLLAATRFGDDASDRERDLLLASFANSTALGRLLHGVSRDAREAPPEMVELLAAIPGNHLESLVALLTVERGEASRRVTRSLIETYVPRAGQWIVDNIGAADPAIATELLQALTLSDTGRAMDAVVALLTRPEIEVQLAVLQTTEVSLTSPLVVKTLTQYMNGPHEEVRVRALEQIGRKELRATFPALVAKAKRDAAAFRLQGKEAAALGVTLARLDAPTAMRGLREWARPKGLGGMLPGHTMLQWVAVSGLATLPGDEPEQLIKYVHDRAGDELQKHCVLCMVQRRRQARAGPR
jgi:hypothetical protein